RLLVLPSTRFERGDLVGACPFEVSEDAGLISVCGVDDLIAISGSIGHEICSFVRVGVVLGGLGFGVGAPAGAVFFSRGVFVVDSEKVVEASGVVAASAGRLVAEVAAHAIASSAG